ncbi:MAG: methionyl-tRNA formyltransferase [Candidatus Dadabacteria bacterium]|nr:methionyl-tRNA formyltransferase [Candidatus Dadabacteria bacterium]
MKILFAGTPEFAVPSLEALCDSPHEVIALLSKPDRPRGRSRKPVWPETKKVATERGVPVFQPQDLRTPEFEETLKALSPDLIAVVAYGKMLPAAVLDAPPFGCVNVHASLLPSYRGAAPINWAIAKGEKKTGVTAMQIDEKMDAGDILAQREVLIGDEETAEELSKRLSLEGAHLLLETIDRIAENEISPVKQNPAAATYAPLLSRKDGRVDWNRGADEIKNLVRAMIPWPCAHTTLGGKNLKILRALSGPGQGKPGEIVSLGGESLDVATGNGILQIFSLQIEGGRKMEAPEFKRGRKDLREGQFMGVPGNSLYPD